MHIVCNLYIIQSFMPEAAGNEKVVVKVLVKEELVGRMYDA